MNQTSLKTRAVEYIKNYVELNLDKYTQIDLINFLKGVDQEDTLVIVSLLNCFCFFVFVFLFFLFFPLHHV